MKPIYILIPHWVRTGGPEALHQLADALIGQGFDARTVYYASEDVSGVGEDNGRLVSYLCIPREFPDYGAPSFPDYGDYKINPHRRIDCAAPCVVVLSETLAHLTPLFPAHVTVLIWWLSADNAFGALSRVNLNHLRKLNVWHATQSSYAAGVVSALGLRSAGALSDYTVDLTRYATPLPTSERPKLVCFSANPSKVVVDLDAIIAETCRLDPDIECVKIANMSREEIAALFARARVYVDLGSFPGKDRAPREAASMGCVPLIAAFGAGGIDLASHCVGDLSCVAAEIVACAHNPLSRASVGDERAVFFEEVRDIFSGLAA